MLESNKFIKSAYILLNTMNFQYKSIDYKDFVKIFKECLKYVKTFKVVFIQ